jgi:uncharacterized protein (TIGR03067 family)
MSRTVYLFAALLVLPSLGSDAPKEYDGATELDALQGTWRRIALKHDGRDVPLEGEEMIVTYLSGKFVWPGNVVGSYTVDTSRKPAHLTETIEGVLRRRPEKSIYRIDGDTLQVGSATGQPRDWPHSFDDKNLVIVTYKRVK